MVDRRRPDVDRRREPAPRRTVLCGRRRPGRRSPRPCPRNASPTGQPVGVVVVEGPAVGRVRCTPSRPRSGGSTRPAASAASAASTGPTSGTACPWISTRPSPHSSLAVRRAWAMISIDSGSASPDDRDRRDHGHGRVAAEEDLLHPVLDAEAVASVGLAAAGLREAGAEEVRRRRDGVEVEEVGLHVEDEVGRCPSASSATVGSVVGLGRDGDPSTLVPHRTRGSRRPGRTDPVAAPAAESRNSRRLIPSRRLVSSLIRRARRIAWRATVAHRPREVLAVRAGLELDRQPRVALPVVPPGHRLAAYDGTTGADGDHQSPGVHAAEPPGRARHPPPRRIAPDVARARRPRRRGPGDRQQPGGRHQDQEHPARPPGRRCA